MDYGFCVQQMSQVTCLGMKLSNQLENRFFMTRWEWSSCVSYHWSGLVSSYPQLWPRPSPHVCQSYARPHSFFFVGGGGGIWGTKYLAVDIVQSTVQTTVHSPLCKFYTCPRCNFWRVSEFSGWSEALDYWTGILAWTDCTHVYLCTSMILHNHLDHGW